MPVNINGYNLSNSTGKLAFGASSTTIAPTSYGVSDPALPGMYGSCTDGVATYKCYPYPINALNFNNGSPWSTSTFRFTCPVAGIYLVSYAGIVGNGAASPVNGCYPGGVIKNGALLYHCYKGDNCLWLTQHSEVLVKCAAGDTLAWAHNIAPAPAGAGTEGAYRSNHNHSTIFLVG
jgi:hypothetical protein